MSFFQKQFYYKVFDNSGTYLGTLKDSVNNEPSFRTIINGGSGELIIKLAKNIDDFGEGGLIAFNNNVQCWIQDYEAPNGLQIFDGFISGYKMIVDGGIEYIEVTCLSYASTFPEILLRDGTLPNSDTTLEYLSYDPSDILNSVIAHAAADGCPVTEGVIDATSETVSYTFQVNNIYEAIERCRSLAPYGWYWYIDGESKINFKASNTIADHSLILNTHLTNLDGNKRMENVKNVVYFVGGDTGSGTLYKIYERGSSIADFGRRVYVMQDQRVTLDSTADTLANNYLNQYETYEVRTTCRVLDSNGADQSIGYDIESIRPGDMITISVPRKALTPTLWDIALFDVDLWDYAEEFALLIPMQVQSVGYNLDYVDLELSSRIPQVSKRIEDLNRNLQQTVNITAPNNPTV